MNITVTERPESERWMTEERAGVPYLFTVNECDVFYDGDTDTSLPYLLAYGPECDTWYGPSTGLMINTAGRIRSLHWVTQFLDKHWAMIH